VHDDPKAGAVLNAALAVFGRYGFKKTSMEAIAKAAGISRPGLYLMYPNKEELYRATITGVMLRAQTAAETALSDQSLDLPTKLVTALDELIGQYVESEVARDIDQLIQDSSPQLQPLTVEYGERALATIAAAVAAEAPSRLLTEDLTADHVTDILFSAALQWKYFAKDRDDFRIRVARLVTLVLRAA
jgi:AcrR family transcriptional regulator